MDRLDRKGRTVWALYAGRTPRLRQPRLLGLPRLKLLRVGRFLLSFSLPFLGLLIWVRWVSASLTQPLQIVVSGWF